MTQYEIVNYNKTSYCTSPLVEEIQMQELIHKTHLFYYLEVLYIDLHIFLALEVLLEDNIVLKES